MSGKSEFGKGLLLNDLKNSGLTIKQKMQIASFIDRNMPFLVTWRFKK